jgi:isopentenyl-diphosphate delta-isomerase
MDMRIAARQLASCISHEARVLDGCPQGLGVAARRHFSMDNVRMGLGGTFADVPADSEALILVDECDREVGHLSKALCHSGRGVLHRAFSLFIFNESGELLLQRRAATKQLWPHYWSNSCCSHPRRAEPMEMAIHRRLYEELGIRCGLKFLFKFQYHAQFEAVGAEHELCSVFIGHHSGRLRVNRDEIESSRWVSPETLQAEIGGAPAHFTPWFLIEWTRLWRDHRAELAALQSDAQRAAAELQATRVAATSGR